MEVKTLSEHFCIFKLIPIFPNETFLWGIKSKQFLIDDTTMFKVSSIRSDRPTQVAQKIPK
jgi:hypothetical protein